MYTDVNPMVTGYQFFFENEENENILEEERKIKNLRVDYLSDGEFVYYEEFEAIDEKTVEKIQQKLNKAIMINLNVFDSWTEAQKNLKRNKLLGVANMFRIDVLDNKEEINVTFIRSGYKIANSIVKNVSAERMKKIKRIFSENMEYNLTCTQQCQAVTWLDLLAII